MRGLGDEVYVELKRLAGSILLGRVPSATISPTVLVHEVWLKLAKQPIQWNDHHHYLGFAATAMRGILVDYARSKTRLKRGGQAVRITFTESQQLAPPSVERLEELLVELESLHPLKARIVELRFFCGCSTEEIATVLDISTATVKRHWRFCKAWLYAELTMTSS